MAPIAPLIVITGPTASGKTSLAIKLAKKWGGEIVCADSRTVYKGMDIGTAKPTVAEQKTVRHCLLDVATPDERFTAADFQRLAREAIADIRSRGKIPFLVGGTGLYIDSVVLNFVFGPEADFERRAQLENMTVEQLQSLIIQQHRPMPENIKNKRYLVRSLEKSMSVVSRKPCIDDSVCVFAVDVEKTVLEDRIRTRTEVMFDQNILQETQQLFEKYGRESEAMTGNIYRIVGRFLDGELSLDQAKELCVIRDRQLAKKQLTWLKRHDHVKWGSVSEISDQVDSILQNS